tara:strand:- start:13 stop:162 length:150 start_codon:yes stop_codon:yes gene_type:complete
MKLNFEFNNINKKLIIRGYPICVCIKNTLGIIALTKISGNKDGKILNDI